MSALYINNLADPDTHDKVREVAYLATLPMSRVVEAILADKLGDNTHPALPAVKQALKVWNRARKTT